MSDERSTLQDEIANDVGPEGTERVIESYSVVLDSIRSEVETADSFALKFAVLLKIPVTKAKHMVRRLPSTIWKGGSHAKAKMLVELAAEAGGNARVVANEQAPPPRTESAPKKARGKAVCQKCGFPLKPTDEFCNFCMTPVNEQAGTRAPVPTVEKRSPIPPSRLLFYLVLMLAATALAFLLR